MESRNRTNQDIGADRDRNKEPKSSNINSVYIDEHNFIYQETSDGKVSMLWFPSVEDIKQAYIEDRISDHELDEYLDVAIRGDPIEVGWSDE